VMAEVSSCIRYAGSKSRVADLIMDRLPDGIEDWREPFFGSGAVTIRFLQDARKSAKCKRIVVNDLYYEVYALWKCVQENPSKLVETVVGIMEKFCPKQRELTERLLSGAEEEAAIEDGRTLWAWARERETIESLSFYERAARFYIVNHISFSALGDSASFSAPMLKKFNFGLTQQIFDVSKLLQRAEIYNESFENVLKDTNDNSFTFLDPPYFSQETVAPMYGFRGSMHAGFNHEDFLRVCKGIKGKFLITYDDSLQVRRLFKESGFYIEPYSMTYTIAVKSVETALAGEELFISNYKAKSTVLLEEDIL